MADDQKFSFLAPHYEEKEVGGKMLKFYAVSTRTLFKLKVLAGPIAQSLVTIMSGNSQDIKRTHRDFSDPTTGDMGQETVMEAIDINLAAHRENERSGAIEKLIEAIADDSNRYIIGELICDSLREEFDRPTPDSTVREFMDDENMTLPALVELMGGVISVNKGAFGPLAEPLMAKMKAAMSEKLGEDESDSPTKE